MLSVKMGLRMELDENDLQPGNTAVVRRRVREPKHQKPGRKGPLPGDISLENLEQQEIADITTEGLDISISARTDFKCQNCNVNNN